MPADSQTIVTRQGDAWDVVARRLGWSEVHMGLLLAANPDRLSLALFPAGAHLSVPRAPQPVIPASLPPWKRVV